MLGPAEHIRDTFTRDGDRRVPLAPLVAGARRRVRGRQPRARCRRTAQLDELFGRFAPQPEPEPYEPAPAVRAARARQRARLQPVPSADVLPARGRGLRPAPARRAGDLLDAARRLDGLAPVRRDPRAARPRLFGPLGRRTLTPTCRCCSCRPGSSRASASRRTGGCARSSPSCASRARPRPRSSAPGRTRPARARSRSRTPAPSPGTPPSRRSSTARTSIPTRDRAARRGHDRRGRARSPPSVADELSVAVRRAAHRGGAGVGLTTRCSSLAGSLRSAIAVAAAAGGGVARSPSAASAAGGDGHPVGERDRATAGARHRRRADAVAGAAPPCCRLQAALRSVAARKAGPDIRRARLRPDRAAAAVRAARRRQAPAGVGREAVHDGRAAAQARPRRPAAHDRARHRPPRAGGVWHGNLYLRGGGDPTFGDGTFNRVWELGYGPTAPQLARPAARRAGSAA